mmetsp:Transcript_130330/g.236926  ORF Transcript_130330/g.236926 Transcript_130330/m.236926 type:complete len:260 (+) Transcript_130330:58-837(+)
MLLLSPNPGSSWRSVNAMQHNKTPSGSTDVSNPPVDRYRGVEQLKYRPAWRGNLHKYGSFIYPLFAAKLVRAARTRASASTAVIFSLGVEGIMAVSAVLHKVKWQHNTALQRARFFDYSMIFVGIALLYQSLGASLLGHTKIFRRAILPLVWGGAAVGIGAKALCLNQPRWVEALAFLAQGWACMLGARPMREAVTPSEWRLVLAGGLAITAGVAAYTSQWPDFSWHRSKFRAHEAFHLSTVSMFACFYCAMDSLVRRL